VTIFARHAWPVSSPIGKDLPKRGELSRDLVWGIAHFTHRWDHADRRTSWKLGRALRKDREIVFAAAHSVGYLVGFVVPFLPGASGRGKARSSPSSRLATGSEPRPGLRSCRDSR
jgi:hypothetical protein